MIVFLFDVLADSGANQYIVQKEEVDRTDLDTAWTLGFILKLMIAIVLFLSAGFISDFFETTELTLVIQVISFILPISALKSPGLFILRRELNYRPIVKVELWQKVFSFAITMALAFYLQNYWAMILGVVVSYVFQLIGSYFCYPYLPKLTLIRIRQQWGFSKWMLLKAIVGYIKSEFDTVYVSKMYNIDVVGGFSIMKNLSMLPAREIISPLSEPLLATFSKAKNNNKQFAFQLISSLSLLLIVTTPISIGLFSFHSLNN
jgi:PST family polysaccharide transporter